MGRECCTLEEVVKAVDVVIDIGIYNDWKISM